MKLHFVNFLLHKYWIGLGLNYLFDQQRPVHLPSPRGDLMPRGAPCQSCIHALTEVCLSVPLRRPPWPLGYPPTSLHLTSHCPRVNLCLWCPSTVTVSTPDHTVTVTTNFEWAVKLHLSLQDANNIFIMKSYSEVQGKMKKVFKNHMVEENCNFMANTDWPKSINP